MTARVAAAVVVVVLSALLTADTAGTTSDAPAGGDAVTARGRPARQVTRDKNTYVVVDLGDGRLLTLTASRSWTFWGVQTPLNVQDREETRVSHWRAGRR